MIAIDHEKCSLCKACVSNCHTTCMSIEEQRLRINHSLCSTCGQCVAICQQGALSWNGVPSRKIQPELLPQPENLLEMLKARRSVRKFQKQPIEREKLEQICHAAKLAPTNVYNIELIVITNPALIQELEQVAFNFIKRANAWMYSLPPVYTLLNKFTPAVNEIDKVKTANTLRRGTIFHNAPALILTIADPRIPHSELSCQYALYNMALMAQTLGLGSCISGAGKMILTKNKTVHSQLNIPQEKRILGILFLGYPDVKFTRTVEGNLPPVHWFESV